jgi:hypothetical protein
VIDEEGVSRHANDPVLSVAHDAPPTDDSNAQTRTSNAGARPVLTFSPTYRLTNNIRLSQTRFISSLTFLSRLRATMPKRSRSITPTLSKLVPSSANVNGVASGSGTAATPLNESPQKSKKLKLLSTYASKSPFPDWAHPTPEEAKSVHAVLCEAHPQYAGERVAPKEENDAAWTCGKGEFLARFGHRHLGDEQVDRR